MNTFSFKENNPIKTEFSPNKSDISREDSKHTVAKHTEQQVTYFQRGRKAQTIMLLTRTLPAGFLSEFSSICYMQYHQK